MATPSIPSSVLSLLEDQYPGLFTVTSNRDIVPTEQSVLQNNLQTLATQLSPGLTTNLSSTLIEDITSSVVAALLQMDQMKVAAVNAISPLNAPSDMLDGFGEIYGVKRGQGANPSVYVNLTGTAGLFLAKGFQFTDGQYLFETQENVTIPSTGFLPNLYILATTTGGYTIPPYSVTQVVGAIPRGYTLSVENTQFGTMGEDPENDADYRARVLQAGMATCQGTPGFIKTCLQKVPNIISRSIAVKMVRDVNDAPVGYSVMADGGDPSQIAGAIYESCFDLLNLRKSVNTIAAIERGNPCTITTEMTHGLKSGQNITISGVNGPSMVNGNFVVTVNDGSHFTIPVDTTSAPLYTGGGILETNARDMSATITDGNDNYVIPFIRPLKQQVRIICHWQTSAINIIDNDSATQLCAPSLANYINSIQGGDPINLLQLGTVFEAAILQLIPSNLITELSFEIYLDDVLSSPRQEAILSWVIHKAISLQLQIRSV